MVASYIMMSCVFTSLLKDESRTERRRSSAERSHLGTRLQCHLC